MEKEVSSLPEWLQREVEKKNTITTIYNNLISGRISTRNFSPINGMDSYQQLTEFYALLIPGCSSEELFVALNKKLNKLAWQEVIIDKDYLRNKRRKNAPDIDQFDEYQLGVLSMAYRLNIVTDDNISFLSRLTSLEEIIKISFDVDSTSEIEEIKEKVLTCPIPDRGGSYIPSNLLSYFTDLDDEDSDLDLLENFEY
ncbi:MAG: hypothetical protein ACOX0R_00825 [Candidatus Dojkabacteria bacterium]|jgi:hypothetical protein